MKLMKSIIVCLCFFLSYFSGCVDTNDPFTGSDISNLSVDITVNSDGSGDFVSIQDALNASHENDIIFVFEGIYFENLLIDKPVYLIGMDPENTIIDGNTTSDVIDIIANHVIIQNLTIQNSGLQGKITEFNAGVSCNSNSNQIVNCILRNNTVGILVHLQQYNTIEANQFYDNIYGIYTTECMYNTIANNSFHNNNKYGVYLYSTSNLNYVMDNVFFNNTNGLRVKGNDNLVVRNVFQGNTGGLYICCGAFGNMVYHNSFINNSIYQGKGNFRGNNWSMELPVGGNYWHDYNGEDTDGDGIGDSIYVVYERNNSGVLQVIEDKYPLIKPIVISKMLIN
jgi:parallel beta-helix repeat protein